MPTERHLCISFPWEFLACEDMGYPMLPQHDRLQTSFPGQLLQQAQNLVAMNKPPMRDQLSLRNYVEGRRCLVESESAFAYHKEDLVTLRPGRDHSFVDAFVERMLRTFHCGPLQVNSAHFKPIRSHRR